MNRFYAGCSGVLAAPVGSALRRRLPAEPAAAAAGGYSPHHTAQGCSPAYDARM